MMKTRRLTVESLEQRCLLTGDIVQVGHFFTWNGEIPSTDVAGITYHPPSNRLYLADSEINELGAPIFRGFNIFVSTLDGRFEGQEFRSNNSEPTGITYNRADGFFYVTNDDQKTISKYDANFNLISSVTTISSVPNATDPEDVTSDAAGRLYVADGRGGANQVLVYNTFGGGITFERSFSVAGIVADAEGIAYDDRTGNLFIVSAPDKKIFEFTTNGAFVQFYDIAGFRSPDGQRPKSPQGLAFAPTTRQDLYPGAMALYIADAMVDNFPDGQVFEAIINGGGIPGVVNVRVSASSDDADERKSNGQMDLTSGDLDLGQKIGGVRFQLKSHQAIPPQATILSAFVQFQIDNSIDSDSPQPGSLTIHGEKTANAATFTTAARNISSRTKTTASVSWSPPLWSTSGLAGPDQRTPSLVPIIQEIVNGPGWAPTNALALIVTGTGKFEAESFDGIPSAAALLHVKFAVPGPASLASFQAIVSGIRLFPPAMATGVVDGIITRSVLMQAHHAATARGHLEQWRGPVFGPTTDSAGSNRPVAPLGVSANGNPDLQVLDDIFALLAQLERPL